jgi:hypothetical protein
VLVELDPAQARALHGAQRLRLVQALPEQALTQAVLRQLSQAFE